MTYRQDWSNEYSLNLLNHGTFTEMKWFSYIEIWMFVNVTVSLNFVQNSEVSNKKVILFNRQDLLVSVADQQNSAELCFYTVSCGNPNSCLSWASHLSASSVLKKSIQIQQQ